jgi:hypothetical protein
VNRILSYIKEAVKYSLYLIKHHAMKMYGEMKIYFHTFLPLARDGGGHLHIPATSSPEWVQVGLDAVVKKQISSLAGTFN